MKLFKRLSGLLLALLLLLSISVTASAEKADFEYKLTVTDQNGAEVYNPRSLKAGDTLNVEIELTRKDTNAVSYETYGLEFRIRSRGLDYNYDGTSFRNGTEVTKQVFDIGDSVGFAYYDMNQKGERINNPVLAGKWSYTVTDPGSINITVPVAVMYIVEDSEAYEPVGNARLFLDPNGGTIIGKDVSGEYRSGTVVTLPDAQLADYVFQGWSDGANVYPAGSEYTVTGIVTLTAQWEGLERNRQIIFQPNGGELEGEDPGGMYADGEVIVMPEIKRDGFKLLGWQLGDKLYQPGEEYVVDNSVVFIAQWEEYDELLEGGVPRAWYQNEDGTTNPGKVTGLSLGILAGLGALGLLLILLFWRRYILYSLKDGSIQLEHKEKDGDFTVQPVLYDKDEDKTEYRLDTSERVEAGHKLRFIKGTLPVIPVEKGVYDGKLIVTMNGETKELDRKIKVVDRELKERENK